MTTIRRFCCNDLLRFANVNLDHLTETVSVFACSLLFDIAESDGVLAQLLIGFSLTCPST